LSSLAMASSDDLLRPKRLQGLEDLLEVTSMDPSAIEKSHQKGFKTQLQVVALASLIFRQPC